MTSNGAVHHPHRRSSSSDRFLTVFSPPQSDTAITIIAGDDDELNEGDVFWSSDSKSPSSDHSHHHSFRPPDSTGVLAALPEYRPNSNLPIIYRKPSFSTTSFESFPKKPSLSSSTTSFESFQKLSISSSSSSSTTSFSRAIPSIPKPKMEREKYQHSAPVKVPVMARKVRNVDLFNVDDDVDGDDEEMLPPHEIVARGSVNSPNTTFSVLEGVGRTLKGRDLRQVRNAVWRQTGFLD